MRPILPRWSRSAALPFVLLSTILAACSDGPAPLEPNRSVVEDSIEYMDPGETYCDDDLWANGCTVVAPPPPPPPPSWDPCTSKPEGCYSDPGIGDPGDGGGWGGGGGAGGGDGSGVYDDSPSADDSQFDCHLAPSCTLNSADSLQKTAMKTAVEKHINQSRCPQVYNTALALAATAQVWREQFTSGGATYRGDYLREKNEMHLWVGNFESPDKWLPWTLAHEAVHALQFELGFNTHEQIHSYGDSCLNFTM
jgi:hypothetical protein